MVMSDSDNTDILLQITSDYFINKLESKFQQLDKKKSNIELNNMNGVVDEKVLSRQDQQSGNVSMPTTMPAPPPSAAYQFLSPRKKVELNHINTRIHNMICDERERLCGGGGGCGGSSSDGGVSANGAVEKRFVCGSEISSISGNTVQTKFCHKFQRIDKIALTHSTPKGSSADGFKNEPIPCGDGRLLDENVLQEIDSYLERRSDHYNVKPNEDAYRLDKHHARLDCYDQRCVDGGDAVDSPKSNPDALSGTNSIPSKTHLHVQDSKNLISLSDIWGGRNGGQISGSQTSSGCSLKEEQLRRQHLEKTVHSLQTRLLEYQQRISVAIEVDRTKDEALRQAEMEMKSVNIEYEQIRQILDKLELEKRDYHQNMDSMQKDLTQAVGMVAKFQEKSEQLEAELTKCTKKCNESSNLYKQQIEELDVRLHGVKKSEEFANNELIKLKDRLAKAEYQTDKYKMKCEELEKENNILRHQKENLFDSQQKHRAKMESFEAQKKHLQDTVAKLTENEEKQKKRFDIQQKSLKTHYQQQLEKVVSQKMREFQEQLDRNELDLRQAASERERLLAERSVKQLEMINDKNELELRLMQEKHSEEVELYRLQLANASKTITDLEEKLHIYKTKRADIAEKLHSVMEMQWQKALEILTSPTHTTVIELNSPDANNCNELVIAGDRNDDNFTTPKSNRHKETKANLALIKNGMQPQPLDKLQAYIELLLSKSPSDFEKLDEILTLTDSKTKINGGKGEKSMKRNSNTSTIKFADGKPPWKAC